ncbi:MAG: alpha,2-fucosyltransferase [Phycisphaerales bacterium]|nr:alpha,2-fucosyltransferase [Phycisphaerales bacterium]
MIITTLISGLGNQLFQYAAGFALAKRLGTTLRMDTQFYQHNNLRPYELGRLCVSAKPLTAADRFRIRVSTSVAAAGPTRTLKQQIARALPIRRLTLADDLVAGCDPAIVGAPDYTLIRGYWQNEGYFADCQADVRREFAFRSPPDASNAAVLARIRGRPSVCLHVRRGDYLNPAEVVAPAPLRYYADAIAWMRARVPGAAYYVFSDDPEWARSNLPVAGATFVTHNTGKNDPEDLRLMSACDHFVIANSTFSWWGAWLAASPGKLVVAPRQWFSKPNANEAHIVPDRWVRL